MTISSWIVFDLVVLFTISVAIWFCCEVEDAEVKVIGIILAILIFIGAFGGLL